MSSKGFKPYITVADDVSPLYLLTLLFLSRFSEYSEQRMNSTGESSLWKALSLAKLPWNWNSTSTPAVHCVPERVWVVCVSLSIGRQVEQLGRRTLGPSETGVISTVCSKRLTLFYAVYTRSRYILHTRQNDKVFCLRANFFFLFIFNLSFSNVR